MVAPALSWASRVLAPRCGVTTTPSSPNSGDDVVGSSEKTSKAAPPTRPSRMASARAASSTIPPRAALTIRIPGLARASTSWPMRPTVSAVLATWMAMKSDRAISSSSSTSSTLSWRARSGAT